ATFILLPETQHRRDELRASGLRAYTRVLDYLNLPEVRRLLWISFFNALPFSLYVTMFSLFAKTQLSFTAEQTGYFLGFIGLLGIIWQGAVIGPVVKRCGD